MTTGIGSGMSGSFGYAAESSYGTREVPTKFAKVRSASANFAPNRVQGAGIVTGSFGPNSSHYVETYAAGSGTVALDVPYRRMGVILNTLMGGTVAPVQQGVTTAYLQTHTLANTFGKSMTCQVGVPQRDGTVLCHELDGCKITSAEFTCGTDGLLGVNLQLDAQKFDITQTLAAVSHDAGVKAFHGGQMAVKIGTYGSETAVKVRSATVRIERSHDTEDYVSGTGGLKDEPVLNGPANIGGSFTVDWTATSGKAIQDYITSLSTTSLIVEFVAPVAIASTYYPTIRFKIPNVTWEGDMQGVDGPAELQSTFNFVWRDDESGHLPAIEYMSVDTTL